MASKKPINDMLIKRRLRRLLVLTCGLWLVACGLTYSQDDYLRVEGNIKADTMDFDTFDGDTGGLPSTLDTGKLFYDFTTGIKQPYIYNGAGWRSLGAGAGVGVGEEDKTVATRIVAAWNSIDSVLDSDRVTDCPGNGTACFSPRADYTCDGTDDQEEINQAINDLGTIGGAVYLLEGTYNISGSINLDNVANLPNDLGNDSNKSIIGTGKGTVLKLASAFGGMLATSGIIQASSVDKILITNFMIDGNSQLGGWIFTCGVLLDGVNYSKIEKLWIQDMAGAAIFLKNNVNNNLIINNYISGSQMGGIVTIVWATVGGPGSGNIIAENVISNNNIWLTDNFTNNIISSNMFPSGGHINLNGGTSLTNKNNIIANNSIVSTGEAIVIEKCNFNVVSANLINGTSGNHIHIKQGGSHIISANRINSYAGVAGVRLAASSGNLITGNHMTNSAYTFYGIDLYTDNNNNNNIISANYISHSSTTHGGIGITIRSPADNNYLVGNHIFMNCIGICKPLEDLVGTSTKYTDKAKMTLEKKEIGGISGSYTLDVATNPQTYISFNPTGAITLTLANGKAAGDLLILENIHATNSVSLSEAGNPVNLGAASRSLGQYDTLELIWNGTVAEGGTGKWLEVKWVDN